MGERQDNEARGMVDDDERLQAVSFVELGVCFSGPEKTTNCEHFGRGTGFGSMPRADGSGEEGGLADREGARFCRT